MNNAAIQPTQSADMPGVATISEARGVRDMLSRNVSWLVAARLGYMISRLMIPPFVVSRIGLQSYGLWSAIFVIISYLGVSTLGVSAVYVKYVAEYAARGETSKANSLLSTGLFTTIVLGLAIFASFAGTSHWILSWMNLGPGIQADAHKLLLLVVAMFVLSISLSVFTDSLVGSQKIADTQVVWVASYLVETAMIFVLVGTGHGIMGLAEAFAVRLAIEIGLSAYLAFKLQPWLRLSFRLCSREAFKALVNFGGIVQLSFLLSIALNSIERTIAAPLVGLNAVGLLDLSDKLPNSAATVSTAFSYCFMPAASFLQSRIGIGNVDKETVLKLYLKGGRYMNLAAAVMLGLLATASVPIMHVWMGKVYVGAPFLLAIFAVQQQFHTMTGPGTSILKGLGRPTEDFYYIVGNIAALSVAIPTSRFILGEWSAVGLGSAVVAATIVSALLFLVRAHYLLAVPWSRYLKSVALPATLPFGVGLLCAWPLMQVVPGLSRLGGAFALLCGGLCYAAILALLVDRLVFDSHERAWFRAIIRRQTGTAALALEIGSA